MAWQRAALGAWSKARPQGPREAGRARGASWAMNRRPISHADKRGHAPMGPWILPFTQSDGAVLKRAASYGLGRGRHDAPDSGRWLDLAPS
eukprot:scaffold1172_cov409-Prasinococcus_capsulatus_cf.AAC.2